MIRARFETKQFSKTLADTLKYSYGFVDGIKLSKLQFNQELGAFIEKALYKYIDAKARANVDELHHVYEWGKTGSSNARLFEITTTPMQTIIKFSVKFLPSSSLSSTSSEPFVNKANVMENGIEITIAPKNADFLVFDIDNRTIFTNKEVVVSDPGGPHVAGSFERIFNDFFENYLTVGLLRSSGILKKLENPKEYVQYFPEGVNGGGRSSGIKAGKKYLSMGGTEIQ